MGMKILIAEDGAVSRCLLRKTLDEWGYSVTEVQDGTAALQELQKQDAPKLAILDWVMPGLNGTEVVEQLRKENPTPYIYVLLLTAKTDKSDVLAGLESGADDYLTKPFDSRELRARLRVGERIIHLEERLQCALSASEFRASHDALTGLYNRGTILSLLEREAARCLREELELGIILADVDHFKSINDTHGHATGDQVLLEVAGRMQSTLRSYDFLGRYGGEEFLIVLPACSLEETHDIAERLRQSVGGMPVCMGDIKMDVTISLGTTMAGLPENIAALLQRADVALYDAKQGGRNVVKSRLLPKIEPASSPELAMQPELMFANRRHVHKI